MILASFLDGIFTIIADFVGWVEQAVVFVINLIISGIGTLLSTVIALLPAMPAIPTMPAWITTGLTWCGYWFPISFLFSTIVTIASLWIAWLVIRIPLRWGKANPE